MTPAETIYHVEEAEFTRGYETTYASDDAPNPRVAAAARRVAENFDGLGCEALNCPHADGAGTPVGFYLAEDAEDREVVRFAYTAIVDDGTRAFLICEDCHAALLPREDS